MNTRSLLFRCGLVFAIVQCCVAVISVDTSTGYVITPLGWVWSDCVHEIPDGAHIFDDDEPGTKIELVDGSIITIPDCLMKRRSSRFTKPPQKPAVDAEGWQVWSSFNTPDNSTFTSFLGNFNVPAVPPKWPILDEGILYMFTGLQNDNWVPTDDTDNAPPGFDIIQPVLQYGGGSSGGGGKYWALASWYVTIDDSFLLSPLKKVNTGDNIFGNMTKTGNATWFVGSTVVETGVQTNLYVTRPRLYTQPWAYCTLEVYNIGNCNWFPSDSPLLFTNMSLTTANGPIIPKWDTHQGKNPCQASITVQSPQAVTIDF